MGIYKNKTICGSSSRQAIETRFLPLSPLHDAPNPIRQENYADFPDPVASASRGAEIVDFTVLE